MGLHKLLTQTKGTLLQQKYLFNVSLISLSHLARGNYTI